MKNMKKLLALLLAVVLCLGMTTVAMAADDGTIELSVTNAVEGHTYYVFQILTGTVSSDKETLSDISVGKNWSGTVDAALNAIGDDALAFAKDIAGDLNVEDAYEVLNAANNFKANVAPGYYLVKDTSTSTAEGDAISEYMVQIVGKTTITPKQTGTPTPGKEIEVVDDKKGGNATSSYGVGDAVPFVLTAKLPDSIGAYEAYKLVFQDTLSSGLSFNAASVKVYVNDIEVTDTTKYTVAPDDANGFSVTMNDVTGEGFSAKAGDVIKVKYNATLLENAKIKEENKFHLEYSNDPNSDGMGTTTEIKVTVFTFELDFTKVDEDGNPLADAKFTLYKKDASGSYVKVGEELSATPKMAADGETVEAYEFSFTGLGEGDYKLSETTTPDGYNTMADKEFTITATLDQNADPATVKELTVTGDLTDFTATASSQIINGSIENNKGSNLPSTGGIGTTIFYVIGGILVVGAGVLLITKKRMSHNG